ncbi:MAG TPA: arsenate reductase (azurin) small subunit [Nitrososphaerales archaeon]|nr:arsenate reductase (azurin) small subunit [Nitrososphaerales archaeon]
MAEDEKKAQTSQQPRSNPEGTDEERRGFLKVAVTVSALLAVGGTAAVSKSITERVGATGTTSNVKTFPKIKVASLSDLQVNKPVVFNYPLDNEPNILVKLGQKATGGVGPDADIVAFSLICQHLGCIYSYQAPGTTPPCNPVYKAPGPQGYCCCHGSVYDFADGAKVVSGPSPRPQPQVILNVDTSGDIFAVGMSPPAIFGHNTGSTDVTSDLQGGNIVS